MIINNRYEEPYNKFPNDGPIPLLSKPIVISKLSKKFWLYSQYLRNENILQDQEPLEGEEENNLNTANKYNNYLDDNDYFDQMHENDIINIKNKRDKKLGVKTNMNDGGNLYKKKNININYKNNNVNEINQLNDIIFQLQNELNKQDFIINSQINEKMKLTKRIHELEQVLNNFC